ncbi:Glycosyl transferases group 1 [Caulifigura coniformis]|uniref:Glycosyl transferases group 1 n=2 Tax=Caulifigura coniformis TaxID=2527983 RepID=A0A517SGX2_9PLAN|nr:Glycosyl transferases group 1 [Caulifigura coniformis]
MAAGPSVTIVALNASAVINPQAGARIGGLETFAWNLARALAADRFEAFFAVRATTMPPEKVVDGVTLLVDFEPLRDLRRGVSEQVLVERSFPWLRVKKWSPALLWRVPILAVARLFGGERSLDQRFGKLLSPLRPGIVIALGVSAESAAALAAAEAAGHEGIIWLQSNGDLDERFFREPGYRNVYGVTGDDANACLKGKHLLIAQTEHQRERLRTLTGRECAVIQNPVDLDAFSPPAENAERRGVLWIGRYDRFHKRPLLALEIARNCPEIPFLFVINDGDPAVAEELRRSKPENVSVVDFVPRPEMPGRFRSAAAFLSTGSLEHEGFPNVLLEAAAAGLPIVSLHDFDGFLKRSECGIATDGDLSLAASSLAQLARDRAEWLRRSVAGRAYVEANHSMAIVLRGLRPLLRGLESPVGEEPEIRR